MTTKQKPPYWIDHLAEKHECFPYGETKSTTIQQEGRTLHVLVPDWVATVKPLAAATPGVLLMLLGELDKLWDNRPLGVLLVAKRRSEDEYETVVWHELYPYALKHLGYATADAA